MLKTRIVIITAGLLLCLFAVGCGRESSQQHERKWNQTMELTSVDLMEQSAEALKKQYANLLVQPGNRAQLLPMFEAIAKQSDSIDWEDFYGKNNRLESAYSDFVKKGEDENRNMHCRYVSMAKARRGELVSMRTEPRLECARISLSMGNKQDARDHLRKLLDRYPTFVSTVNFMVLASQAYEPHDIEFQKSFRVATEDSARQPGVKDRQYHIWWLDQVLTQKPADGQFKFEQDAFPKKS
ncbi:MAG: hypothetical protein K2W95_35160 [Candidatus Obscuribacterales bacterium]|nr:hypothetical protein [Candidatus Obscuribacterales bacterium]